MNEEEREQLDEMRDQMRRAMSIDVAKYDQNLATYKNLLESIVHVGDAAYHDLAVDLVVPTVGAFIQQSIEDSNLSPERVIFDLMTLLSCAVDEILILTHEQIEEITK